METVYKIIEALLPFNLMKYEFMKNALLAIIIITPLFGILGTMIVNNKMAFFSDALGHSALTGIAIGIVFGAANNSMSMFVFAVIFALLLNNIKRVNSISTDTIISVFSSLSIALGLVLLSNGGNFAKYSSLLVGDILSITPDEILTLLLIFIAAITFWGLCFNKLLAVSLNVSLAKSKGIKIKLIDDLFAVLIAVIVMFSIQWLGILIINALLILPAAAARNFASNMREYHLFSVLISIFSGISGLILSFYLSTAAGPTIVIIASLIFFAALLLRPFVKN